jgi:SAM-dependent methyltransferase
VTNGTARPVIRVLFALGRTADRAARVTHYLAGGMLRLRDLQDGVRVAWQDHYRLDLPNTTGLMPWEQDLVDRFVRRSSDVLIAGCGSGRDVVALAERGCRVTGVEPSGLALATARRVVAERGLPAALVEGFFEDAPLAGPFDTIIFSYYCYMFVPGSRRRIAALAKASALLKPGGHVVVSHPLRARPPAVLTSLARMTGALSRSDWRAEPGDLIWDTRLPSPAYSYCHAFADGEVDRETAAAGLKTVFSRDTDDGRAYVLARA